VFYFSTNKAAKQVSFLLSKEIHNLVSLITKENSDISSYDPSIRTREISELYKYITNQQQAIISLLEKEKESKKLIAIGETTSMLAHDVRKPFSQIQTLLSMLETYKNNPKAIEIAKMDIEKSIKYVESMLSEVMDFSREVKLKTSPCSIISIIEFAIRQTAQNYKKNKISFKYFINNKYKPLVDEERISRVFINIFSNAIEAITHVSRKDRGVIFIETRDFKSDGKQYIEICLANDGPKFEEDEIPNLFELFFTRGKKRGTGLGLASSYKTISLHDGNIVARNRKKNEGVEFVITLLASSIEDSGDIASLPKNIEEAVSVVSNRILDEFDELLVDLISTKQIFNILLLEDEALYRASVRNTIKKNSELSKMLTIYDAHTVEDAVNLIEQEQISHAIVDVDLEGDRNGFDFIEAVKGKNIKCMVHSNRHLLESKQHAKKLGVKVYVPKPLSIEHLVLFLLDIEFVDKVMEKREIKKKVILYCDDEKLFRLNFETIIKEIICEEGIELDYYIYSSGEELLEKLGKVGHATAVFTDQYMDSDLLGTDLIDEIRKLNIKTDVYVVSNSPRSVFEEQALSSGAKGYIVAPLKKTDLLQVLL
jgi:signal transduction histidine kinase/DNA-binding NarL/FixJ family response regulator